MNALKYAQRSLLHTKYTPHCQNLLGKINSRHRGRNTSNYFKTLQQIAPEHNEFKRIVINTSAIGQ